MISKHGDKLVNQLFHDIKMLIARSLFAVQHVIIQDKHCFELYGYDILVDQALKPWLLEVKLSLHLCPLEEDLVGPVLSHRCHLCSSPPQHAHRSMLK